MDALALHRHPFSIEQPQELQGRWKQKPQDPAQACNSFGPTIDGTCSRIIEGFAKWVKQAGAWGVYVPHELTWAHEHAEPPRGAERFRKIAGLSVLAELIEEIG